MSAARRSKPPEAAGVEFRRIPVGLLRESEHNPRKRMDERGLEELADSIRAQGILSPLLVRPVEGGFEIAAGHRRFRAAIAAGVAEVPALVREMSDTEILEALVVDNEHREDVHPLEQAEGYRQLQAAGYAVAKIAERVGRPRAHVEALLGLRRLRQEVQDLFYDGTIHLSHAKLIAPLPPEDQLRLLGACERAWSDGGLLDDANEAPASEERPALVSTRRMASWIEGRIPIDLARVESVWGSPRLSAAVQEVAKRGGKAVAITRLRQVPAEAGERRILTARAWKRADGSEMDGRAEPCEVSMLGVVVLGPGRGEAFDVCVDRLCDTHWGQEELESGRSVEARHDSAIEQEQRDAETRRIVAAIARGIFTKVATRSARFVRDHLVEQLDVPARALFDQAVPKGKFWRDVSAMSQQAALAIVVAAAAGGADAEKLAAMAVGLGVNLEGRGRGGEVAPKSPI